MPTDLQILPEMAFGPLSMGCALVIDLIGFSEIVDGQIQSDSRLGTERVFEFVQHRFSELTFLLAEQDFRICGFTGDGLTAVRNIALEQQEFVELAQRIVDLVGLPAKVGTSFGRIAAFQYPFEFGEDNLCLGDAIEQAYYSARRFDPATSNIGLKGDFARTRGTVSSREKMTSAILENRRVLVFVLEDIDAFVRTPPDLLRTVLDEVKEVIAPAGRLDGISQDEKGIIIRCSFEGGSPEALLNTAFEVDRLLAESNLTTEHTLLGYAEGLLYSAPFKVGGCNYSSQSPAINLACKTLLPFEKFSIKLKGTIREIRERADDVKLLAAQRQVSDELWGALNGHSGSIHLLCAGPGEGKSTILGDLRRQIRRQHPDHLIEVAIRPQDQWMPFRTIRTIVERMGLQVPEIWNKGTDSILNLIRSERLTDRRCYLVVDDLHWCDPDSLKMLSTLIEEKVFGGCVAGVRPSGVSRLPQSTPHILHQISPLDEGALSAFFEDVVGMPPSGDVLAILMQSSGGNLFAVSRILLDLAERRVSLGGIFEGKISLPAGVLERARHEAPNTVAAMRTLALSEGFSSRHELSVFLHGLGITMSSEDWNFLHKHRICMPPEAGEPDLKIAHSLLSGAIRDAMPEALTSDLHGQLARFRARRDYDLSVIARHWQGAGAFVRAASYYFRAIRLAYEQSAYETALSLVHEWEVCAGAAKLQPGLAHLEITAIKASCFELLGEIRQVMRTITPLASVQTALSQRNSNYWTAGRRDRKSWAMGMISSLRQVSSYFSGSNKGMFEPVTEVVANPFGLARAPGPRSRMLLMVGMISAFTGLPVGYFMNSAMQAAEKTGRVHDVVTVNIARCAVYMRVAQWREAEDLLLSQRSLLEAGGGITLLALIESLLAVNALLEGDVPASRYWFEMLGRRASLEKNRFYGSWSDYGGAECDLWEGQYETGLQKVDRALVQVRGNMDRQSHLICLGTKTALLAATEQHGLANMCARKAATLGRHIAKSNVGSLNGFAFPIWHTARFSATPEDRQGKLQLANLADFARMFPIARPRLNLTRGLLAIRKDKQKLAEGLFVKALKEAHQFNMKREIYQAKNLLDALEDGDITDAAKRLY